MSTTTTTTGTTTEAPVAAPTTEEKVAAFMATLPTTEDYLKGDQSAKAAMRAKVTKAVFGAIKAGGAGIEAAQAGDALLETFTTGPAPKAETDWSGLVSVQVATLRAAADLLEARVAAPADLPEEAVVTFGPGVMAPNWEAAWTLATEALTKAANRDLNSLLREAVTGLEAGFYTLGQLRKEVAKVATARGFEYLPSGGAVEVSLKSVKGVPGAAFVPTKGTQRAGAQVTKA